MTERNRENGKGPSSGQGNEPTNRRNIMSRRDEQLDEELRGQLRKKNEESRRNMLDNDGDEAAERR